MRLWLILLDVIRVALQYALPYFLGKQKAEAEHEREEKEAVIDTANSLANRAVDRNDLLNRLRKRAANQDGKDTLQQ
jgi:Arc/MetJ-type ribon-helix-helix transcriptional regulator